MTTQPHPLAGADWTPDRLFEKGDSGEITESAYVTRKYRDGVLIEVFVMIDNEWVRFTPTPPADVTGAVKPGEIERAVWSAMIWAASNNPGFEGCPEYTDRGNSFAETEARRATARILSALSPPIPPASAVFGSPSKPIADSQSYRAAPTPPADVAGMERDIAVAEKRASDAENTYYEMHEEIISLSARVAELEAMLEAIRPSVAEDRIERR